MTDREVVITAREQAELLPMERSQAPLQPDEVAGRTLATLVSAGTELAYNFTGANFPGRPGYAAVFQVEEAGSEVRGLTPGDVAFCMGPHRSYQRAKAVDALPVPAGLPPEQAVFARLMGVTMSTLTTTTARPPQQVLVVGLGLVGHLAAQTFQACGYTVAACDPVQHRRDLAQERGIQQLFPGVPVDELKGQVALVLECSGHDGAALDACRVVRKRGEVVLVGTPWRRYTDHTAQELTHAIFHQYVVMRSGWEWEVPRHDTEFGVGSQFQNFAAALRWLSEGRVRVEGLYQCRPPEDAPQVYHNLLAGRYPALAAVFDWRS